jgi:myo-inositol-hexaphosphate 3-phosphohydrolase
MAGARNGTNISVAEYMQVTVADIDAVNEIDRIDKERVKAACGKISVVFATKDGHSEIKHERFSINLKTMPQHWEQCKDLY